MKKILLPFLVMSLLFVLTISPDQAIAEAKIGTSAPDFTLTDSTGTTHTLSKFKGKTVVLEWTNFDCPYVRKHYDTRNMQSLQEKYTKDGVVWLLINSSAPGKQGHLDATQATESLEKEGAHATAFLHDPDGVVGKKYGARTTPHMYIINDKGILVYAGAIDDNSSSRHAAVKTASNFVAAALDSLKEGTVIKVSSSEPYGCSVKYSS